MKNSPFFIDKDPFLCLGEVLLINNILVESGHFFKLRLIFKLLLRKLNCNFWLLTSPVDNEVVEIKLWLVGKMGWVVASEKVEARLAFWDVTSLVIGVRKNDWHLEELGSFLFFLWVIRFDRLEFGIISFKSQVFEVLTPHRHLIVSVSKEHKQVIADYHRRVVEAFISKIW